MNWNDIYTKYNERFIIEWEHPIDMEELTEEKEFIIDTKYNSVVDHVTWKKDNSQEVDYIDMNNKIR